MTKDENERIELLEEAQKLITDAIDKITEAVDGTAYENECKGYILGHLSNWANGDNPYDYTTIPKLIERIQNGEEDE